MTSYKIHILVKGVWDTVLRGKFYSISNLFFFGPTGIKVMITTGFPTSSATTRTTEVVDVVIGETCADLIDFPLPITGAVGANLDGTPVVCGGTYFYNHKSKYMVIGLATHGMFVPQNCDRILTLGLRGMAFDAGPLTHGKFTK